MTVRVETESETARNLLVDNLPQLRERLDEQGIRIERFDVDLMNQSPGGSQENLGSPDGRQQPPGNGVLPVVPTSVKSAVASESPAARTQNIRGALDVLV